MNSELVDSCSLLLLIVAKSLTWSHLIALYMGWSLLPLAIVCFLLLSSLFQLRPSCCLKKLCSDSSEDASLDHHHFCCHLKKRRSVSKSTLLLPSHFDYVHTSISVKLFHVMHLVPLHNNILDGCLCVIGSGPGILPRV